MLDISEVDAVSDVLQEGLDFLANALAFYGTGDENGIVADADREMVAALSQAIDYLKRVR